LSAPQAPRQAHVAKAHPHQPADPQSQRLEQAAHLAIAPFTDDDMVPMVGTLAAAIVNGLAAGHAIVQPQP